MYSTIIWIHKYVIVFAEIYRTGRWMDVAELLDLKHGIMQYCCDYMRYVKHLQKQMQNLDMSRQSVTTSSVTNVSPLHSMPISKAVMQLPEGRMNKQFQGGLTPNMETGRPPGCGLCAA